MSANKSACSRLGSEAGPLGGRVAQIFRVVMFSFPSLLSLIASVYT